MKKIPILIDHIVSGIEIPLTIYNIIFLLVYYLFYRITIPERLERICLMRSSLFLLLESYAPINGFLDPNLETVT